MIKRGEIYLISLDPTQGHEQRGHRPVVVSPDAFNAATKLPVVSPITNGGNFARRLGFAVSLSSIRTTGIVRCDQPRVFDLQARHARKVDTVKVDTVPADQMLDVLARVSTIFA